MAHGRNAILRHVEQLPGKEKTPDYLLSFDMDGLNHNMDGLETCEALPAGWGGCCVNQRELYYDLWVRGAPCVLSVAVCTVQDVTKRTRMMTWQALRTQDDWTDCDVYSGVHGAHRHSCTCNGRSEPFNAQGRFLECILLSRNKHIPKSAPPIQVDSCFGGATIYDWRYIRSVCYLSG
eukprot:COSAG01_NODE_8688_length_2696_cov_4.922603_4_plen_178_part_00